MMQDLGLYGMPRLQLCPGLATPLFLRAEQVTIARRRFRTFGQLSVDPVRIFARSRQRDLELVWPAMAITPIECVAIGLSCSELFQTIEESKTGQLTGLRAEPGGQRIRCRIADETLQPLSGRDEGRPARPSCG